MDYAIILAGGKGSRFWPLSRECLPKQFLKITGKCSLLEATLKRCSRIIPRENIFIVTHRLYLNQIKKELKDFRIPERNIILEPRPLNTLPAIGLCSQILNLKDPQANLLVLPADHYIKDSVKFKEVILKALKLAQEDFVCLIGVKPDSPHSGYGYINTARPRAKDIFYVHSFKEKPSPKVAQGLFREKDVFWNAGIFCFKAQVLLKEIQHYLPCLYRQISSIKQKQDVAKIWPEIKPISIDYGLLQKSKRLIMLAAKFYWRDLGSWEALCDVLPKDNKNNIALSDSVNLGSQNIFTCSQNRARLIATIGLKDLIIVDTPDALLVCRKGKSEDIKRLVGVLKKKRKKCV